jgi:hypothetical protein
VSGLVAVCLAVHRPDPELLRRQLASLEAQTYHERALVRFDDTEGVGAYRGFERAFERVPGDARFVAPCDQDDAWHPDKLAVLVDALERSGATLAFGDLRIVRPDGRVISPTYWTDRSHECDDLGELLATNVVTGAGCVARRAVLDVALPFPPELDGSFHDHWLAVCALALGELAYVDRALVDYVQHGANVVGHAERRWRGPRSGEPWAVRARRDRERHVLRPQAMARALLERAGERMPPAKLRAAERAACGDETWGRSRDWWWAAFARRWRRGGRSTRGGGRRGGRCGTASRPGAVASGDGRRGRDDADAAGVAGTFRLRRSHVPPPSEPRRASSRRLGSRGLPLDRRF